jgi:hypothetical protein
VLVGTRAGALTPYVADGAPGTATAPRTETPRAEKPSAPAATRGGSSVDEPTQALAAPTASGRKAASKPGPAKGTGRSSTTSGQRSRKAPR